jgi:peptidoglycan/xylan/chitin deacetylase (PgdA/CDA1 family)
MAEKHNLRFWFSPTKTPRALVSLIGDSIPLRTYQRLILREILGLVYHVVSTQPGPHVQYLYANKTPAMFESDLLYLTRNFELPAYDELFGCPQAVRLPHKDRLAAFVSFDDGLAECGSVVQPLLIKHGVPCIFFLITDCIDNRHLMYRHKISLCISKLMELPEPEVEPKLAGLSSLFLSAKLSRSDVIQKALSLVEKDRQQIDRACDALEIDCQAYLKESKPYLTQSQIKTLVRNGFKIGAHTQKHSFLADLTPSEIETEIVASCHAIKDITGDSEVPFAFPFSGAGVERSFLHSLKQKHSVIGPMYDTRGIAVHEPFVFNRLTVDSPSTNGASSSNIPLLLHKEYRSVFFADLKGKMRRFFST